MYNYEIEPVARVTPAKLKILIMSHSHPRLTNGGSEIAAFRLFTELDAREDVDAWFIGCDTRVGGGRDGVALTQPFSDREYVYSPKGQFDWFHMANADKSWPSEIRSLLLQLKPDIIHLHHYANFGAETFWIVKQTLPHVKVIVTLHEYLAICNHFGQMVKTGHFSLCENASFEECHSCFPNIAISDFFTRNEYLQLFFQRVDHFISPSHFLKDRYLAWGIDPDRISKMENVIARAKAVPKAVLENLSEMSTLRVGFFGQISKLKGMGVLIECARILSKKANLKISFDIYGDYKGQPKKFQEEFEHQLTHASSNVNYHGTYRQDHVDHLMCNVDVVLVPSIWWENSPTVIQEALRNRIPVICSDIGGMAEKIRSGVDGFQFPVGNGLELSHLIEKIYHKPNLLLAIKEKMSNSPELHSTLEEHLALYAKLMYIGG